MSKWTEKFNRGCEMWFMFQDYWNLVQNYWNMEDSDEYWDSLFEDCNKFLRKYPKYFPKRLIYAFIEEQERKQKGLPEDARECSKIEQEEKKIVTRKEHV